MTAEEGCSFDGRQHAIGCGKQPPTGTIEIIEVMIVTEKHRMHRQDAAAVEGRSGRTSEDVIPGPKLSPGWIKAGIGQEADATQFQQSRGTANVSEAEHVQLRW